MHKAFPAMVLRRLKRADRTIRCGDPERERLKEQQQHIVSPRSNQRPNCQFTNETKNINKSPHSDLISPLTSH